MQTYSVIEGDTWSSIALAHETPVSWLMLSNGLDPNASPAPSDPAVGSTVTIPDGPPDHCIAPENNNGLDLGIGGLDAVKIRLHDSGSAPMTNVRYRANYPGGLLEDTSDDGWIEVTFPAGACASIDLEWGAPDEDSDHPYRMTIVSDCFSGAPNDQALARLNNLGFDCSDFELAVRSFQYAYGVDEEGLTDDGDLPPSTLTTLNQIFDSDCDATLPSS